ncbi:MAG TPA: hypothetical protein PLA50_08810 [Bacteroidia bacterium]|nr:hypothetical protein [Bacteroidia bacterium]
MMRNHYDSAGRVMRREWAGDPVGWTGYRGGRIEPALDPSSEATYPLPEGAAPTVDAPLAVVSFDYDNEGRHVASRVGDQVVLRLDYGPEGKVVRAERTGRFVRAWSYADDKVVETLELPGLPEGPYGFVGSSDPGVTGDLVVRRESVPGGPALLEVYLDGTSRRLSYDGRGRLSGEERFGRDASSPALSIRYVYSPDGSRVGEIEDNRLGGKTSYYQRPVQADGLWGHREKVTRLAFP